MRRRSGFSDGNRDDWSAGAQVTVANAEGGADIIDRCRPPLCSFDARFDLVFPNSEHVVSQPETALVDSLRDSYRKVGNTYP
jgi:hypothetical protein